MRFFNAASAIVLGLASVAHGHKQIIDREVDQSASTSAPISASASHVPGGVFITTTSAEPTAPVTITVTVSSSVSSSSSSKQESSIATSVLASSADTVPHRQPPRKPQSTTSSSNSSPSSPSMPFRFSNGTAPTNSSTTAGSRCSREGQYNCQSDGQKYQRCAAGLWSIPMPVALGNPCQPGMADTFVSAQKRSSPGFVPRRRFVYEHRRGKRASSRMD
ncbi:uncharacterized protein TrAtP1_005732 [Trichoderma atroviride]|uniref:uncharacterized protein n=1 Tax=Hypocrea atroviridis TaxID=63577 RepID=UPI003316C940|nr:hypothetical protein TrAtP1_005732 [Trichoderma atroviride]